MKYLFIFVFALILSGCSDKPTITLIGRNGSQAQWTLVSVRDTSLVLLPPYEELGKGIAFTHCVVVPIRSISKLVLHPRMTFLSRLPLGLFGAGVGAAIKACNCDDRIYHFVLGFVFGWIAGGIQLFLEGLKEDTYYLWLNFERERLRKESVYPIEPPIMQYVK